MMATRDSNVALDIVIGLDHHDIETPEPLLALFDSLAISWDPDATPLRLTAILADGVDRGFLEDEAARRHTRIECRHRAEIGLSLDFGSKDWAWKDLLDLAYAYHTAAPYYLVLSPQAFCLRRISPAIFLPHGKLRTEWETNDFYIAAIDGAYHALGVRELPRHVIDSRPTAYASELARRTLARIDDHGQRPALELLAGLARRGVEISANILYTIANLNHLSTHHHMPDTELAPWDRGLHSGIDLWADEHPHDWSPKRWAAVDRSGIFMSLHQNQRHRAISLDAAYAALKSLS